MTLKQYKMKAKHGQWGDCTVISRNLKSLWKAKDSKTIINPESWKWDRSRYLATVSQLPGVLFCFLQALGLALLLLVLVLLALVPDLPACLPGLLTSAAAATAFCSWLDVEKFRFTFREFTLTTDWGTLRITWPGFCGEERHTGRKNSLRNFIEITHLSELGHTFFKKHAGKENKLSHEC